MNPSPAPGFQLLDCSVMPFNEWIGPLYWRAQSPVPRFGLRVLPYHCDELGNLDRGVVATFADFVAGRSLVMYHNYNKGCFTISLNLEFIGQVPLGGWIETQALLTKPTGGVAFSGCEIICEDRIVAIASGKFKLFDRKMPIAGSD